ncbi:MAG: GNAT family N-acetyltransferase [Candidatus Lokiarchaeota archaeon]|nr:GNAT family N-acetyltransferase [Candidatus Lokiarchaeota archaeon]
MSHTYLGPVYRIKSERLVIRCYNPKDALYLQKAIQENVEHLRPWMPWVKSEPEDLKVKIERLRVFRADFDLSKNFVYGVFDPHETELVGGTGLHPRVGSNAFEIGYWIHVNHINKGYATEISAALTKVAFEIEHVNRVEIHCDPNNIKSAAIPRKLGYVYEATLRNRCENIEGELIDSMIWSISREEYPKYPGAKAKIVAYDVFGTTIIS